MLPTVIVPIWLLIWKFVQADIKAWDKCWPLRNQNHGWKCQVTSLIWPASQQHIAPRSIKHGQSKRSIAPFHPVSQAPWLCRQPAYHYGERAHIQNVTKTGIQRIIGRRCRCAGCRALRPENSEMCFEWQVEVSHTGTAGHNDISAWQSYTTKGREAERMSACNMMWGWHLVLAVIRRLE